MYNQITPVEVQEVNLMYDQIIPHNSRIKQANSSKESRQSQTSGFLTRLKAINGRHPTPLQQQALELYDAGLNVFPQPLRQKAGLPWKQLQYTRLHRNDPQFGLYALFLGECNLAVMCGKTSQNLFIIDCESRETLTYHIDQLRERGIPLWAVRTGRGGHIYLRCSEGEIANIDSGTLPNAEVKGCRGYVLAPPSLHPSGTRYEWLSREGNTPPSVKLDDIDWLVDKDGLPIKLKLDKTGRKGTPKAPATKKSQSTLSRATQDYLSQGSTLPEGCRNNRLFSAACDMAGNNYSYEQTLAILSPIAQASGLPKREINATIKSAFSKARSPAKPRQQPTPTKQNQAWEYALSYIQEQPWRGRTGTSDRAVMLALTERARVNSNENGVFRASIREIAAIARIGTATAQKAIRRLLKSSPPLIFRAGQDKTSNANLWRFSNYIIEQGKHIQSKMDTLSPLPHWSSFSVSDLRSTDAVERGALGQTGLRVYRVLCGLGGPAMPRRIAAEGNLRVHQVNYALKKLAAFGLVERLLEGWCAVVLSDADLDEQVARPAGVLGSGEARRLRYAEERALYVGRILLTARLGRECDVLFAVACCVYGVVSGSGLFPGLRGAFMSGGSEIGQDSARFWMCPNCGQLYFGEHPPDMCDVCRDFTTWRQVVSRDSSDWWDDPLVLQALALGAVVSLCDDCDDEASSCPDPPG